MSVLDITTIYNFRSDVWKVQVEIDTDTGIITEATDLHEGSRTVHPGDPDYPSTLTPILDANYPDRRWTPIYDDYTRNKSCAQSPWTWVSREEELFLEMNLISQYGHELVSAGCLRNEEIARSLEHVFILEREPEEADGPPWTNSRLGLLNSSPSTVLLNIDHEEGQCLRQFMWEPTVMPMSLGGGLILGEEPVPDPEKLAMMVRDPSLPLPEPEPSLEVVEDEEQLEPHGLEPVPPVEEFDYTAIRNFAGEKSVLRSTLEIATGNLTEEHENEDGICFTFLMPGDVDYPSTLTPFLDRFYRVTDAHWSPDDGEYNGGRMSKDYLDPWFWVQSGDLTTELTVETRLIEKFGARLREIDELPEDLDKDGRKLRLSTHAEIWRTLHYFFIEDREKLQLNESWEPGTARIDRDDEDGNVIYLSITSEDGELVRQYAWFLPQDESYAFDEKLWHDYYESDEDYWFVMWESVDPDDEFPPADPSVIAPLLEPLPAHSPDVI